jgi:hypothetical protein
MILGRKRRRPPSIHRFTQTLYGKRAHRESFSFHGLFQVDHHHDAGLHGGAEECDETDPNGNREVVPAANPGLTPGPPTKFSVELNASAGSAKTKLGHR